MTSAAQGQVWNAAADLAEARRKLLGEIERRAHAGGPAHELKLLVEALGEMNQAQEHARRAHDVLDRGR